MNMSRWLLVALLCGACGKKEDKPAAPPSAPKAAEAKKAPPPAPVKLTSEQQVKRIDECMAWFDAKDWKKAESCYAADSVSMIADSGEEPARGPAAAIATFQPFGAALNPKHSRELTLVDGNTVVVVWAVDMEHTGELMGIAPTNKKFSINALNLMQMSDDGKIEKDLVIADMATLMGHLGQSPMPHRAEAWRSQTKDVVIAADTDAERANVELVKKGNAAWMSGDVKGLMALLSDDFESIDFMMPENLRGKKAVEKMMKEMMKAFSESKIEESIAQFGAGDYVVDIMVSSMKNTGDIPSMKLKKTGKTVTMTGGAIFHITGGKTDRGMFFGNGMAFAAQMGLIPGGEGK
jgi:ketosteroid isomerase-like protein